LHCKSAYWTNKPLKEILLLSQKPSVFDYSAFFRLRFGLRLLHGNAESLFFFIEDAADSARLVDSQRNLIDLSRRVVIRRLGPGGRKMDFRWISPPSFARLSTLHLAVMNFSDFHHRRGDTPAVRCQKMAEALRHPTPVMSCW
jgi:hypothetical protein